MKTTEEKAVRLVVEGRVRIESYQLGEDGRITEAHGFVRGDSGSWLVQITPEWASCNCPFGIARQNAAGHSHDRALELEVYRVEQRDQP